MSHVARDEAFAKYVRQTGMATDAQVEEARTSQAASGEPLAEALVRLGVITLTQKEAVEKKLDGQGVSVIGGCRLIRKLGEGGMGAVYLAERTADGRKVALKILPKKHATDVEFIKRFHREAEAAAALDHENIARGYAAGEEKGYHYYLMEYCEGEALGKRLKRAGALSTREATGLVLQVARGLAYAHERGFIHRDIKPDNILLTASGVAKILDLGLSKNIEEEGATFHTATGAAIGTPHYIAPEQARGEKLVDGRADLYALGATYYHLVTGTTPFQGASVFEVINKHLTEQLPDPRDAKPGIPEGVVLVIRRLMAKRVDDRYPAAPALAADLERVLAAEAPLAPAIDPALSSVAGLAPGRPRRTAAWIAGGVAALALAVAGVWWLSPPPALSPAPPVVVVPAPVPPPKPPEKRIEPSSAPVAKAGAPEDKPDVSAEARSAKAEPPKPAPPEPEPVKPAPPEPVKTPDPAPPVPVKAGPRPEPAPAAIKAAEAAFREPLKADYAATAPSDRAALARKLLEMPPPEDPTSDFIRLRDARDLAAQAGDAAGVLEAVNALAKAFVIDLLAVRAEGLSQLGATRTSEAARAAATACLVAGGEAMDVDRYDLASKLLSRAEAAAKDAKADDLAAAARGFAKDAAAWSKELATMSGYVDTLKARPDDPASNAALGKFACFLKDDWAVGLPRLAKGSDPALKALALKDLSNPEDATAQADLCEGWLKQAEKERTVRRDHILGRARAWFDKAAEKLTDADRERLSKRLGVAPAPKPAAPVVKTPTLVRAPNGRQAVDLIALAENPLTVNGPWQKTGPALFSSAGGDNVNRGSVRLWIPYAPPEEYEIFLDVERLEGMEDFVVGLAAPDGKPIAIGFDGWGQAAGSGMFIDGTWRKLVDRRVFENGRRYSVGIHVARNMIRVMVNAQEIMRHANYASMSMPAHVQVPLKPRGLILGAVRSRYAVRVAMVISNAKTNGEILPR
ncbi:MAG TPA: serine/threonine-protein kinase [Planctomycetota bacterium]